MEPVDVKILRLKENAILPVYQTNNAAAMDVHACLDEAVTLQPMERRLIPAGFAVEIPIGYEIQIRARSGLSIHNGITMINGVGTIDADYRGEIGILLVNLGGEDFVVEPNIRIAQMLLAKCERVRWHETSALSETGRGNGGFGSTGLDKPIDRKA